MATMVKIHKDELGELMEHLYKMKKHFKKVCEIVEEGEVGSRRGMSGRRHDEPNRFRDDDDFED